VNLFHYSGHAGRNGLHIWFPNKHEFYITYKDLKSLDLSNLEHVFLNACGTATGSNTGLPHGFLLVGASSVIGNLWPVSDVHAGELASLFYTNWRSKQFPRAKALQQAMITLKSTSLLKIGYLQSSLVLEILNNIGTICLIKFL
jgi:CHAT domain-containing protein